MVGLEAVQFIYRAPRRYAPSHKHCVKCKSHRRRPSTNSQSTPFRPRRPSSYQSGVIPLRHKQPRSYPFWTPPSPFICGSTRILILFLGRPRHIPTCHQRSYLPPYNDTTKPLLRDPYSARKIFLKRHAIPGPPDAGRRWAVYQDSHLHVCVCKRSSSYSGLFFIISLKSMPTSLVADTDYFLVLGPSHHKIFLLELSFTN